MSIWQRPLMGGIRRSIRQQNGIKASLFTCRIENVNFRHVSTQSTSFDGKNTIPKKVVLGITFSGMIGLLGYYVTTKGSADSGDSTSLQIKGSDTPLSILDSNNIRMIDMAEVEEHNSKEKGIWVVIKGQVYDLTSFVENHPGGERIILKNAGKDVTEIYEPVHPSDAIQKNLEKSQHLGQLDPSTVKEKEKVEEVLSEREIKRRKALKNLPPLETILNLDDFERIAQKILTDQAWAYYCSAADDEISKHFNRSAYSRIWFKPRALRPVGKVDCSTTLVGHHSSSPIYISPAAMAKLGHPDGEANLTKAAGDMGIIQGVSANASVSLDETLEKNRKKDQTLIYQMYINKDRKQSEKILKNLISQPEGAIAAIMLTVDAAVVGNRESDIRAKGDGVETGGKGVGALTGGYIDPNLDWNIIDWYKKQCSIPLFLKGIQSIEDVELAIKYGCQGIVLSNHGGRSLDYSRAPIDVLIEIHQNKPELLKQIDVFIDGGVRRGTDVLKAIALGAKGVGLGRPFLYAQSGYGEAGAKRAIEIMQTEIERGLQLLGLTSLSQLNSEMIEILPRSFDPFLLHRTEERKREYVFEQEQFFGNSDGDDGKSKE